jgi:hypothetical protein
MRRLLTLLLLATAAIAVTAVGAGGAPSPRLGLHVGVDESKVVERTKTIPITKRRWDAPRVVASLEPAQLGAVRPGGALEGFADIEVSVTCLEAMPKCVGKRYEFSPHTKTRMILGESVRDRTGFRVGKAEILTCSQRLPDRNHHCRIVLHPRKAIPADAELPCETDCHLNVVMSAYHRDARKRQVLVIGVDADHGIEQSKASLSAASFTAPVRRFTDVRRPGPARRMRAKVPVAPHSTSSPEKVIYSTRLDELRKGEQLLVDARARIAIGGLGYSVLLQPELILSERPDSTEFTGLPVQVLTDNGKVSELNGSNCTQGDSDFSNPCKIEKVGAARLLYNARTKPRNDKGEFVPLYLNLVVGATQEFGGRYHRGDAVRVKRGRISVRRYSADYAR